jgi:2-C-methyl-D-erythritol 4-phosphate cytidylyltransferase
MKKPWLILVAGGTGSRMGGKLPKQFIEINKQCIFIHSLQQFIIAIPEISIVIAVHPDWIEFAKDKISQQNYNGIIKIVRGGDTRFHSVKNALEVIHDDEAIIAIHDAARPLVDTQTIINCFALAQKSGNAIPFIPIPDSIRQRHNQTWKICNRDEYRLIQTPQTFQIHQLKNAFSQTYKDEFTDDASVVSAAGYELHFCNGGRNNLKITFNEDLELARALLKS